MLLERELWFIFRLERALVCWRDCRLPTGSCHHRVGLLDYLRHVLTALTHLQDLLLLLADVRVEIVLHLGIQHRLIVRVVHECSQLILDGFELVHLGQLLLLHLFVLKELLTFFEDVFTHLHGLLKVLIPVLKDLLKGLLIKSYHFLLVLEHLVGLRVLLGNPIRLRRGWWLGRHLLCLKLLNLLVEGGKRRLPHELWVWSRHLRDTWCVVISRRR